MDAMGLGASTSILDGGLPLWKREGRPLTQEAPVVTRGDLQLCPQADVVVGLDYVRSQLHKPKVAIVDARLAEFYTGEKIPSQRRAGHIPGAVNVPFCFALRRERALTAGGGIASEVRGVWCASAASKSSRIAISGSKPVLAYFAARYLGYDARMFDGSWQEWSAHSELPTETSAAVPQH